MRIDGDNYRALLDNAALDRCMDDLIRHEGYVERIYLDPEGLKTFGVGHLVKKNDPEYDWPVDTPVTQYRVLRAFEDDFNDAIMTALSIIPRLGDHPAEVQCIFINMAFNLGYNRLSKFRKTIAAIKDRDYLTASKEMEDSKWYKQVKTRGVELVKRMAEVANGS